MSHPRDLYTFELAEIFTFFFIMLGPLKVLAPFAKLTAACTATDRRWLAVRGVLISALTVLVAGILGCILLQKWNVSVGALAVAGGVLFLLVALPLVLDPYTKSLPDAAPATPPAPAAMLRQVVPMIVSPYGISAVMLTLTLMPQSYLQIIAMLAVIMVLDFLAMLFAGKILSMLALPLQVIGSVMGVLQVALSIQMIVFGVHLIAIQTFGFKPPG